MTEALTERARAGESRQVLLDHMLAVVLDDAVADELLGAVTVLAGLYATGAHKPAAPLVAKRLQREEGAKPRRLVRKGEPCGGRSPEGGPRSRLPPRR